MRVDSDGSDRDRFHGCGREDSNLHGQGHRLLGRGVYQFRHTRAYRKYPTTTWWP